MAPTRLPEYDEVDDYDDDSSSAASPAKKRRSTKGTLSPEELQAKQAERDARKAARMVRNRRTFPFSLVLFCTATYEISLKLTTSCGSTRRGPGFTYS
jgi:hypothetical protein